MATALEANAAAFLALAVLGLSALLLVVSALGWWRLRNPKILFVSIAFGVLAVKGALGAIAAWGGQPGDLVGSGLDLGIVLLLYGSVAKR